jgi:hypothetical protein
VPAIVFALAKANNCHHIAKRLKNRWDLALPLLFIAFVGLKSAALGLFVAKHDPDNENSLCPGTFHICARMPVLSN